MEGFTQDSQLLGLAVTTDNQPLPSIVYQLYISSVVVLWQGFLGGAGQAQPQPVFLLRHPAWAIKQSEMATTYATLGDSQVKPSCDSNLAAARAHWSQLLVV